MTDISYDKFITIGCASRTTKQSQDVQRESGARQGLLLIGRELEMPDTSTTHPISRLFALIFWLVRNSIKIALTLWCMALIVYAVGVEMWMPWYRTGLNHPLILAIVSSFLWYVVYLVVRVMRIFMGYDPIPSTGWEPDQMEPGLELEILDPALELAVSQEPFGAGIDPQEEAPHKLK